MSWGILIFIFCIWLSGYSARAGYNFEALLFLIAAVVFPAILINVERRNK